MSRATILFGVLIVVVLALHAGSAAGQERYRITGPTYGAPTEAGFREMMDLAVDSDFDGLNHLADAGKITLLRPGTDVVVVDRSKYGGWAKIKLGQDGYLYVLERKIGRY